jgi:hypothetical protein
MSFINLGSSNDGVLVTATLSDESDPTSGPRKLEIAVIARNVQKESRKKGYKREKSIFKRVSKWKLREPIQEARRSTRELDDCCV